MTRTPPGASVRAFRSSRRPPAGSAPDRVPSTTVSAGRPSGTRSARESAMAGAPPSGRVRASSAPGPMAVASSPARDRASASAPGLAA